MSALTDRIADEHRAYQAGNGYLKCLALRCDWEAAPTRTAHTQHVATVTEAAVREQVARDIEAARDRQLVADRDQRISLRTANHSAQIANRDARIARGGAA